MKIRLLAIPMLLWMVSGWALAVEGPGLVRGEVVDDAGAPVAGAQVSVDAMDGMQRLSPVRMAETDKRGHFLIGNLELGSYKVFAKKESAGYADMAFAFYSHQVFTTVTLMANAPAADVALKVGPKAGVLLGTVTDNATKQPIATTFTLRRVGAPDEWISVGQRSDYRVLVPASTKISLEISATGYKTWYYGGDSDPAKRPPILLESGKEMTLDVRLEPEIRPANAP
jgi:carboxypeptidase family protein